MAQPIHVEIDDDLAYLYHLSPEDWLEEIEHHLGELPQSIRSQILDTYYRDGVTPSQVIFTLGEEGFGGEAPF